MAITEFPPISACDKNGLLAIGGDLEVQSLLLAYSQGIFPWPCADDGLIPWFSPDPRGILQYKDLHITKSLKKLINSKIFNVTFNQDFDQVIDHCQNVHKNHDGGTWITQYMKRAYKNLFNAKYAFSVEVWNQQQQLAGGLYGVVIGGYVCGESMFYIQSNASKVALVALMEYLHTQKIEWLDIQMVTSLTGSFGGREIERSIFLKMLEQSLNNGPAFR